MVLDITDYITSAISLFNGGWRVEDRYELISEYGLTEEEATTICKYLADLEND